MSWNRQIVHWYLAADDTVEATGSEQPFQLVEENDDEPATETLDGEDGWLDVGRFETLTVRIEAGSGVGTTVTLYGKVTRAATKEAPVSVSISAGADADVVRKRDVSDFDYIRVTENSGSDTTDNHSARVLLS